MTLRRITRERWWSSEKEFASWEKWTSKMGLFISLRKKYPQFWNSFTKRRLNKLRVSLAFSFSEFLSIYDYINVRRHRRSVCCNGSIWEVLSAPRGLCCRSASVPPGNRPELECVHRFQPRKVSPESCCAAHYKDTAAWGFWRPYHGIGPNILGYM